MGNWFSYGSKDSGLGVHARANGLDKVGKLGYKAYSQGVVAG